MCARKLVQGCIKYEQVGMWGCMSGDQAGRRLDDAPQLCAPPLCKSVQGSAASSFSPAACVTWHVFTTAAATFVDGLTLAQNS